MGASQIGVGDMYVCHTGLFARDVLAIEDKIVRYRQYDHPEGRPSPVIRECSGASLWRWATRLLDEAEAERIRDIGRPLLLEERVRTEQRILVAATDALVVYEFVTRNLGPRLFDLASVDESLLRKILAEVPDEEIASEFRRRGLR